MLATCPAHLVLQNSVSWALQIVMLLYVVSITSLSALFSNTHPMFFP
jgi:hypothetical protein